MKTSAAANEDSARAWQVRGAAAWLALAASPTFALMAWIAVNAAPSIALCSSGSSTLLQPMDGPERESNTAAAVAYCLEHPQWRLSLQTHKLLGIP
jgi:hypothetical protein